MLTFWAFIVTLTIQARALDLLSPPLPVGNLPQLPLDVTKKVPLNLPLGPPPLGPLPLGPLPFGPLPLGPPFRGAQKGSPSMKLPTRTPGSKCLPVARYSMSSHKLEEYLNATLPPEIKKMLMCEEINLAGLVGTVISTVSNSNLLSVLDLTSSLNLPGGALLGGILDKESGGQSPKLPLPLVSKATEALNIQDTLGSLLPIGAEKNPVKGLVNTLDLPNLSPPLNDVVNQASKLTDSTEGVINSVVPAGIGDAVTGLIKNANIEDLLLGLHVQEVTVESMTSSMTHDGILVSTTATAFIGGKGLAGPVVSLLGFQVHSDITLKIGISTNNTQCVNLQVQDKDIKFKKVSLQLVETLTGTLPVPLPLDQIIPQVLTVAMKENLQESASCGINLSDSNKCKNSTGLFEFSIISSRISAQGLSIFFCAKAFFNKNTVPVLGSALPPDPKNANTSLTLSHKLFNIIITLSVKQCSIKTDNMAASITKVAYSFKSGNQLQITFWISVEKDGENFATVERTSIISHDSKISKNKLIPDFKVISSEDTVTPSEAGAEVQEGLHQLMKKCLSTINETTGAWNVPQGLPSTPPINAKVKVLKSNDLQAAN
ncbi:vomeromodulin-like [Suricata suricatta]|uniref:vomeromodulin-like n=1 Tax=Suricata suricatta TaxID=37032 RepID=UPI00115549CB|nr:vomeromodulin-like [Suricata suricatta]